MGGYRRDRIVPDEFPKELEELIGAVAHEQSQIILGDVYVALRRGLSLKQGPLFGRVGSSPRIVTAIHENDSRIMSGCVWQNAGKNGCRKSER